MTDLQIANMLADYHKECESAETLREKADIQLKHARLIREALRQPSVMRLFTACPSCGSNKIYFDGWWTCRECTHDWGGK